MFDFGAILQSVVNFIHSSLSLLNPLTFIGGLVVLNWAAPVMIKLAIEVLDLAGGSGFGGNRRFRNSGGFGGRRSGRGGSRSKNRDGYAYSRPARGGWGGGGASRRSSGGISSWSQSKARITSSRGSYRPGSRGSGGFRSPGRLTDWKG